MGYWTPRVVSNVSYRRWTGYHLRSLVETNIRRFKLPSERVMVRDFDRQIAELLATVYLD